jgi:Ca-activated chloride channel family protein
MMRPFGAVVRTLAFAACGAVLTAAQGAQVFRSGTDMVLLNVSAVDSRNRPVAGLTRADFQIAEDGRVQDVSMFAIDPQPISLSLLVDTSTSMEMKLRMVQDAAIGFCKRLRPGDVAQVITFDSETKIAQPFTHDSGKLESAILAMRTGGSTSLHTAIYIALNELNRLRKTQPADEVRRQAIVVLSDGQDTSSLLAYEQVLELARRSDVVVYAIGLRDRGEAAPRGFNEGDFVLRSLSQSTGGRLFTVDDPAQLPTIYGQVGDDLANQYTLGYVSKNLQRDGAWRQISVKVLKPNVIARTKSGYFASPKDR